jgi:class 3 adenylate cyclase
VIGRSKFAYDLWGDTVNVASRMESSGEPGKIQVSEAAASLLGDEFVLVPRGPVQIKGKGEMNTVWLES